MKFFCREPLPNEIRYQHCLYYYVLACTVIVKRNDPITTGLQFNQLLRLLDRLAELFSSLLVPGLTCVKHQAPGRPAHESYTNLDLCY